MKKLLVVFCLMASPGVAQMQALPKPQVGVQPSTQKTVASKTLDVPMIVNEINGAESQILVYSRVLRIPEISTALDVAHKQRGVQVYVVTPKETINDGASYYHSLNARGVKLYGVNIREWKKTKAFIIIDQRLLIVGNKIGETPTLTDPKTTKYYTRATDQKMLAQYHGWFVGVVKKSQPIDISETIQSMLRKLDPAMRKQ